MHERPPPQVTVHGQRAADRVADVIGSGNDGQRPHDRRRPLVLAAGAGALALAAFIGTGGGPSTAPAEPRDLALVETGGGLMAQWGYGGRLDVSLPLHIRNDGGPLTIASLALDGTSMAQPAVDVDVDTGGRFPVTLRQTMSCRGGVDVPADAALRLQVRREDGERTQLLALPDGVLDSLVDLLAVQCSTVPLEQAVVLRSEQEEVLEDAVRVRVQADNLGPTGVQLLSVEPASGLAVTVLSVAAQGQTALPVVLGQEPVTLRLSISVQDCVAAAARDLSGSVAVADLVYDDGRGNRAVEAAVADVPGLRDLVERTCAST